MIVYKDAYGASHSTIAGIAKWFVMEGMEAALSRKKQENRRRKVKLGMWKPESAPLPVLPLLRVPPAGPCRQLLMS